MTSPLPVLPQIIVEAGLLPDSPSQGGTTLFLDIGPGLDTGTLGSGIAWTDISAYVLAFTVTRPSTRLQGPLWNYQAATASITLDNSDGRFDPDNLAGPYVSGGVTRLAAMVPVRVRTVFASTGYPQYSGFADGWLPAQVTYEGGYAELTLPATDAFKVLAGVTLAAVSIEGVGAATGARIKDILSRAGWYTSGDRSVISAGNSTVQGTTLGDTALNLMQIAADSEIGQLYVNGSGAVVFRARRDVLTDTRSNTVQAVFGDLPGTIGLGTADGTFETGTSTWAVTGGTLAQSSTVAHSGSFSALITVTGSPTQTFVRPVTAAPVTGGQSYTASEWVRWPVTGTGFLRVSIDWLDSGMGYLSTSSSPDVQPPVNTWTQLTVTATAPSNAAYALYGPTIDGPPATGDSFFADDVFFWPATCSQAALPELACAAITRASDDTTIGNDIQATRANGGTLQEVTDAASIAKYLFPRTYSRTDLILQNDSDALNWAQWVLYVSKSGEDRFESLQIDPAADPYNLWPQVLGREIGDRIQIWNRPAGVASPIAKDCFIAGITHAWDSVASSWLTTWTLQDASKYGSFLTLDNPTLGRLDFNALTF